ncbi:cupin domain-containing protein [Sphingomonas sp. PL-96]|nr:cupin domain-containing protein [Sphingomonas sp. PL-96]
MSSEAAALIATLGLAPHPEGGWYRETWRAPEREGRRGVATAILFLLAEGERSHWHRVDADELWLWHAGAPLALLRAESGGATVERLTLGGNVLAGDQPQLRIPAGWWQAAEAEAGWTLVSCVVAPAFRFEGFELAPPGWSPGTS